jgi:hypothetical protein
MTHRNPPWHNHTFMRARALACVAIALLVACGKAGAPAPRLLVVLSVDGLSWSRLEAARPPLTAGRKRLLDEGAVATACRYGHLNTQTAPGHASIATGAPPRIHGIARNQWYVPAADGTTLVPRYAADDPGHLKVPTLGDRLVAADPRARVVSISLKDRSAIFLAGRDRRHAVYWYEAKGGTFRSSGAYDGAPPARAVVERFNVHKAGPMIGRRYGTTVSRLPEGGSHDAIAALQNPVVGQEARVDLRTLKLPLTEALPWTPWADRLLVDLSVDLVEDDALRLGRNDAPDLLAISFSSHDYVAHDYGAESGAALAIVRGLDLELGRLLDALERRFGREAVAVVLSADHGMMPLPDAAHRVDPDVLVAALNDALRARLGHAPIDRLAGCSLWLRPGAPDRERVLAAVREELATTWARVFESGDALDALVRNAIVPGRSGDMLVTARHGFLVDTGAVGTSHGSGWDYDTHVPLIFWGGGIAPARLDEPTSPYDVAPTIASWLGLELPDATGARLDVR